VLEADELHAALSDAMEGTSVRPPYGGHPRVAIYGLIESRMARADLVICGGLNEGTWPARPATDPLLAPAVLRALGVPGADFRIGLAAHDLAAALGAPDVVLSRARRDEGGPAIASRFLLRVQALLGDLLDRHIETGAVELARALDDARPASPYLQPEPTPDAQQRKVALSVTGLDRLRADPYQFYAGSILRLSEMDALDADPGPAWQGELAHKILEVWHKTGRPIADIAAEQLAQMHAHPLTRALWRPRLLKALEWVEGQIAADPSRVPALFEEWGCMEWSGVTIRGRIDRLDRLEDGSYAVVDYKTGRPPSGAQVEAGYALQLGTLGLMVENGGFAKATGKATRFEYWSLGRSDKSETGFGYVTTPIREGAKRSGIAPDAFLPKAREYLDDALNRWILGDEPFTARLNPDAPGYATYDQLMRLDEWMGREQ
jgi:ATP-dependent helicase/nuclease subunit B